jgi:hypothetical protein
MPPSLRQYNQAEARLKESVLLRVHGIPTHHYPGRQDDLETIQRFHYHYGIPLMGTIKRLWRWLSLGLRNSEHRTGSAARGHEGRGSSSPAPPKSRETG